MKVIKLIIVLAFLASTGSAAWSSPVSASSRAGTDDPLAFSEINSTFLSSIYNDDYTGLLPPQYFSGTQSGPGGGTMTALAFSSAGTLYAGSWGSGVYKSVDHGATWTFANHGLTNGFIYSLAVDPTAGSNTVYAGTYHSGVYKSTDGGATWNPTGPGLNSAAVVYALAVSAQNPNIIFAGTRGDTPVITANCPGPDVTIEDWGGGIFRSTDGGAHWTDVDPAGLSCGYVYGLAVDSLNQNFVYVATHGVGVMRSIDGGQTFQFQNSALSDKSTRAIVIDPTNHNRLYLATWHTGAVFRGSTDTSTYYNGSDAITWNSANTGLGGASILKLAIDPSTVSNYCARLFADSWNSNTGLAFSDDCGYSWTWLGTGGALQFNYDIAIDPQNHKTMYLGTSGSGVNKSIDQGSSWNLTNQGLDNTSVNTLISDPSVPTTFYAGTSNGAGIFKSLDSGVTWKAINRGLPVSSGIYTSVLKIAADPLTPGVLYAGTDGSGVYKSTDSGATWNAVNGGTLAAVSMPQPGASSPLFPHPVPYDAPFFDAGSGVGPLSPVLPPLKSGSIPAVVVSPQTAGTVYAGSWEGVVKSVNGGTNWSVIGLSGQPVYSLAINPTTPVTLYAGTANGVYLSIDGGATWNPSGLPGDLVEDLVVDTVPIPSVVYAATGGEGIFESFDGGETWEGNNQGLADLTVYSVAVDPVHHEFQYAGTASGLYRTTDGGALWEPVSVGLYNTYVDPVMVNPATPGVIYLGTNSGTMIVKFSNTP